MQSICNYEFLVSAISLLCQLLFALKFFFKMHLLLA